jgi:hypothetical protein
MEALAFIISLQLVHKQSQIPTRHLIPSHFLLFQLTDPSKKRYEVPIDTPPPPTSVPENMDYQVDIQQKPFSIKITRKSTGAVM